MTENESTPDPATEAEVDLDALEAAAAELLKRDPWIPSGPRMDWLPTPDPAATLALIRRVREAEAARIQPQRDGAGIDLDALEAATGPWVMLAASEAQALARRVREAEAERDRLARWKAEALPVIAGLQELGRALGVGPGESITGPDAAEKAIELRARATEAEAKVARVEALYDAYCAWDGSPDSPYGSSPLARDQLDAALRGES